MCIRILLRFVFVFCVFCLLSCSSPLSSNAQSRLSDAQLKFLLPFITLILCSSCVLCLLVLVSRRVMGMRSCDSRCLFSGCKGEVCSIEPLHAPVDFRDHPITHYSLLAMASLTKVHEHTVSAHNQLCVGL